VCDAEKHLEHEGESGAWLECDRLGISHELHYDETFDVSWKEGRDGV
jgi:hypothetical protein